MNWDGTAWLQVFQSLGPVLGLLLFFVWRDWRREDLLSSKIEKLEDYQRKTLFSLVEKTNEVLAQNTEQLKFTNQLFERFIKGRLCE